MAFFKKGDSERFLCFVMRKDRLKNDQHPYCVHKSLDGAISDAVRIALFTSVDYRFFAPVFK